jgi:hypothetical protein
LAKTKEDQQETERVESLVQSAESQGLPRPVAQEIVDDAISEGIVPEKLKEVIKETAKIEKEDRELAAGITTERNEAG